MLLVFVDLFVEGKKQRKIHTAARFLSFFMLRVERVKIPSLRANRQIIGLPWGHAQAQQL